MAINPKQVTVGDLFGTKKYQVDFYQREYKWNDNDKEQTHKPITSLLDDIFFRFKLSYKPSLDITEQVINRYEWYYLNSFMTNSVGGNTYIVDGQQRLTTLTIAIICLHKIGQRLGIPDGILKSLESNVCDFDVMGNRVYWMGFPDRVTALERVFALDHNEDTIPSSKENTIAERNIFDAYGTIMAYFTKQLDTAHIFNAFRVYLLTRVYLISIDVDEPKDVAMAFEVINDRGIPLKAHEILKGKILGAIDKEEVQSYVDMWEQSLAPLATCYDDYDETDDFFCILFRAKFADTQDQYRRLTLDKYHKAIYYEEFDRKIGFHINGVEDDKTVKRIKCFVSSDIPYFSKLYLRLIEDSRDWDKPSYALFNAENGQNMQYYLLLSSVESNDPQENEKYALVTRELDRLYMLCHLFSSYYSPDFNRRLVELGKQIRGASLEDCKAAFQQTLVKIISSSHNQRDESDPFKYSYFAQLGYSTLSKHFLRYFFSRIEHFIGLESELPCGTYWQHLRQVRGKDMHHIEHILAWDDRGENCEAFPDEDTFTRERNRLGALVLLKGKDDASSRNELYAEKLKTYFGNGTLWAQTLRENFEKSNIGFKEFREKYNLDIKPYDTFGQTAINERHRLLFEIVRHIWQF